MPERLSVRRLSNSLFSLCGGTPGKDGKLVDSRRFSATLLALAGGSPTRELFLGSFLEEGGKPDEHQWLESVDLKSSNDVDALEQITVEPTVPEVVIEKQEVEVVAASEVEEETQPAVQSTSSTWNRTGVAAALVALMVVLVYTDLVAIAVSLWSFGGRHLAFPLSFSLLEFSEDFLLGLGFMIGFGGVTATCLASEVGKLCAVQAARQQEREAVKAALVSRRKSSLRRRASVH